MKIGLIGASGFIGLRTVELLHGRDGYDIRPIVRAHASLAVLARERLDWRITDVMDAGSLARSLEGCEVCIHSAIGDVRQIPRMAIAAYRACAMAGVRRMVWLSSASVHGLAPQNETDESSPLHDCHPIAYNNAKVRAEWHLDRLKKSGAVEVVKLRPSVVYGPRSRWITDQAKFLQAGTAGWIRGGTGVCNAIFVDNLVEAIRLAATVPAASGHHLLVRDQETITWKDFLLFIARHLEMSESAFANMTPPVFQPDREAGWDRFTLSPLYRNVSNFAPDRFKRVVKATLTAWRRPPPSRSTWQLLNPSEPRMNHEMSLLQQNTWVMPTGKAERVLNFHPAIPFGEGMASGLEWLDRAGWGRRSAASHVFDR